MLLGNTDQRAKLDSDIHEALINNFGSDRVFKTVLNRSVKHREATVNGKTIIEHARGQQAAEQFLTLAREVIERITGAEEGTEGGKVVMLEANRA